MASTKPKGSSTKGLNPRGLAADQIYKTDAREQFTKVTKDTANMDVLSRCKKLNEFLASDFLQGGSGDPKAQLKEMLSILNAPKRPSPLDRPPIIGTPAAYMASVSVSPAGGHQQPHFNSAQLLSLVEEQEAMAPAIPSRPARAAVQASHLQSKQLLQPAAAGGDDMDDVIMLLNSASAPCTAAWQLSAAQPSSSTTSASNAAAQQQQKQKEAEEKVRQQQLQWQKQLEAEEAARKKGEAEAAAAELKRKQQAEAAQDLERKRRAQLEADEAGRRRATAEAEEAERRRQLAAAQELERKRLNALAAAEVEKARQQQAALLIQRHWRGQQARVAYSIEKQAVLLVQALARRWSAQRRLCDLRQLASIRRRMAARSIQRAYRSYKARIALAPLRIPGMQCAANAAANKPAQQIIGVDADALLAMPLRMRGASDIRTARDNAAVSTTSIVGMDSEDLSAVPSQGQRTVAQHKERVLQVSASERMRSASVSERAVMAASENRDDAEALAIARNAGHTTLVQQAAVSHAAHMLHAQASASSSLPSAVPLTARGRASGPLSTDSCSSAAGTGSYATSSSRPGSSSGPAVPRPGSGSGSGQSHCLPGGPSGSGSMTGMGGVSAGFGHSPSNLATAAVPAGLRPFNTSSSSRPSSGRDGFVLAGGMGLPPRPLTPSSPAMVPGTPAGRASRSGPAL